jgi:hypothetical protein
MMANDNNVMLAAPPARLDAQRLGNLLAVHEFMGRGRHLDEHRVDHRLVDLRIGQRQAAGLDVQRHRVAPELAKGGVAYAGDHMGSAQAHLTLP